MSLSQAWRCSRGILRCGGCSTPPVPAASAGAAKVTVDDIATEAGGRRATLYRMFPGGRDILFEALRRARPRTSSSGSPSAARGRVFEDLVVRGVVNATRALRDDEHLRLMLASEPGEVVHDLTVDGLPRIFRVATDFLTPWFAPYIGRGRLAELAEWLARVVISYFLAPSSYRRPRRRASATDFVRRFVLPAYAAQPVRD